jgi:hypothetical protein
MAAWSCRSREEAVVYTAAPDAFDCVGTRPTGGDGGEGAGAAGWGMKGRRSINRKKIVTRKRRMCDDVMVDPSVAEN